MLSAVAGKTIHSIAIKKHFNYFGSICNKSLGVLGVKWTLKSILIARRPKYSVCMVSLHSQRHFKTHLPFLPGVAKLKFDVGWLCWGLTSQSKIFQSCRDGAIASWVINQYFRGVKCLAQGHNTAEVGLEPRTSRSRVRHSTTELPRSP